LMIANGVVQAISRSSVLGIIGACLLIFFKNHRAIRKKVYLYALFAGIGIILVTPYTFWERMGTMKDAVEGGDIEGSAYSRLVIGAAQLRMFQENIFGNGHRGTQILSPFYIPAEYLDGGARSSHCTFLTTLVEQGAPGAVLYWLMVFWVFKHTLLFKKNNLSNYLYMLMISSSLTAVFVSGIFVDYLKVEIQIYCIALLASLIDYEKRIQYENQIRFSPNS